MILKVDIRQYNLYNKYHKGDIMKRLLIIVFTLIFLSACGVPQADYDSLLEEHENAFKQIDMLIAERDGAIQERDNLSLEFDPIISENNRLLSELKEAEDRIYVLEEPERQREAELAHLSAFERFKEEAKAVTYEDLMRYPDTHTGQQIMITVRIEYEKLDSWFGLAQGGFIGTVNGKELVIRDNRDVKEPRVVVGDRVIIFGHGTGLTKMRQQERGLIFKRTVDEWEVPEIEIVFVEFR